MEQTAQTVIDLWRSGSPDYQRIQFLINKYAASSNDIAPLTATVKNQLGWRYPQSDRRSI